MRSYFDIKIGDKETLNHTITNSDIEKFVQLTGDDNKLHIDEAFAGKTQFKKPVVHGMLGASFISTIIGTKLPGDGALWFSQTLEFLLPVRVGDQLTVIAEVFKKNDKENVIELKTDILNQNKQLVTKGIAKVKVIETEKPRVEINIEKKLKTVLVIGSTGGIGKAVCLQLAKDGYQVVLHYHNNDIIAKQTNDEIKQFNGKAMIVQCDILSEVSVKEMLAKAERTFGCIDVLVNCAAIPIPNIKFQDMVWEDFQNQIDVNIKATYFLMKGVIPSMIQNGYGRIITIGSLAMEKPNTDWSHYITAKSALQGLTKSLAFELAPKGIRINMVSPGMVNTDLTADIPEKVKLITAAQTPVRRLANAEDVSSVISFLVSEKANFITGETIRVNGGQFMI